MCATKLIQREQGGVCAVCGAPLEPDALFCIVCGTSIAQDVAPAPANAAVGAVSLCPQCGAPVDADAMFCVTCGARVSSSGAGSPARQCPNCGWNLEPDAMYCISCGQLVKPHQQVPMGGGAVREPGGNGTAKIDNGVQEMPVQHPIPPMPVPQPVPAPAPAPVPAPVPAQRGPITPVPAPPMADDDDDATVRPRLIMLTREEARTGCRKTIRLARDQSIEVNIPADVDVNTKLDVPGYGHFDEQTGQRGPLRLSFYVD